MENSRVKSQTPSYLQVNYFGDLLNLSFCLGNLSALAIPTFQLKKTNLIYFFEEFRDGNRSRTLESCMFQHFQGHGIPLIASGSMEEEAILSPTLVS